MRAQVRIPHKDELEHDAVQNTFHFTGVDDPEDQSTIILGLLFDFYSTASGTATKALKEWMSSELDFTKARLKTYDLSDAEPRVPVLDESLGISAPEGTAQRALPGEVALCLSYAAAVESGVPAARRKGRIYLGPLMVTTSTDVTGQAVRPSSTFIADVKQYGLELASESPIGTKWSVYSQVDNFMRPIVSGFVDDAFDTQRRRGVDATSRNNWAVEL